jgi:alpha-1,6-mannosyltransferase
VGADPDRALWWGAANPLVLFHVVGGAHNDGLMVGLMAAGLRSASRASLPGALAS